MAAQDNLSNELFEAHRGVAPVDSDTWEEWTGNKGGYKLDTSRLGIHWSKNKDVAKGFAKEPGSTIFHAKVPTKSLLTGNESSKYTKGYEEEQEVPVKQGSSVFITGVTKVKATRSRKRNYKQPREMTA